MKKIQFPGRILMIGYGSVGRCTLPILERHIEMPWSRVTVIDGEDHGNLIAPYVAKGLHYIVKPLVADNLGATLAEHVGRGDLILNLSVEVSSLAVIEWCHEAGVLYLDTCIEPWANYYDNAAIPEEHRTNYWLRHLVVEKGRSWGGNGPSALLTHGANPGLISHFVKAALLEIAREKNPNAAAPGSRAAWAELMHRSGIKVIHVAEHDLQVCLAPKRPGEFVNTWSIPGFVGEGSQPAELGWGTHEKTMPENGVTHKEGCGAAIFLRQPGCVTEVRSWTPVGGPMIGYLITHGESITLADYFSARNERGEVVYRPTAHYAYHPCNDAVLSVREYQQANFTMQPHQRLLNQEIVDGIDELGALLMGDFGALWYGSQLSVQEARRMLGPNFNATSIQIAAPVVAGAMWLIEHPDRGVVEPEDLDHEYILEICRPYLGPVVAVRSAWTPLQGRNRLFPEPGLDMTDPWQFANFQVRR